MAATLSSYRLETPRPRPPPLPIKTNTTSSSSRLSGSRELLYDMPTMSPTYAPSRVTSPTSPTGRRASRNMRMTPPPNRAPTPSRPLESDLETFAENCRAWYYEQDDEAGRKMTQTLATLPSSHRAPFARLQASVRSAYHASVNARRNAEFRAHLTATQPGGSLMPHSRADPSGPLARKERFDRFERFVRTWCTMGMPGTKPFFEGLWTVMRLQIVPEQLGGAGANRIEWEIDDAVFKESAGKDFMLEAIDVLKGVLGFEEVTSMRRSPSFPGVAPYSPFGPLSPIHSRSQSTPLPSESTVPVRASKVPPISSTTQTKRPRASSDPFLDTIPTPALSSSYSSANTVGQLSTSGSSVDDPSGPLTPPADTDDSFAQPSRGFDNPEADYMRTWTSPDLPDSEILTLLKVFPPFVVRNPLPRFPVPSPQRSHRSDDLEGQSVVDIERKEIRVGTGMMWVGSKTRTPGWQGSWWIRFKMWWKRVFC